MKEKKNIFNILNLHKLVDNLSGYLETKFELLKIEIKEDLIQVISKFIIAMAVWLVFFIFIAFGSLTLGTLLNEVLDSRYIGFAIISLVYFLFFVVLYIIRKKPFLRKWLHINVAKLFHSEDKNNT